MSRKKEVTPFSIAFLDLLSSALAAVIILFVIVPKTDLQIDILEDEIRIFRGEMELLDSLFADITDHLSAEELVTWNSLIDRLRLNTLEMENQMEILSQRLEETKSKNETLEQQLEAAETGIQNLADENQRLRAQLRNLQRRVTDTQEEVRETPDPEPQKPEPKPEQAPVATTPEPQAVPEIGSFLMGMNPEFAVMINWEDASHSFDLYLKSENRFTDNHNRSTSFGRWMRIPRRYNPNPHQVIMQNEIVPGEYEIYVHLFRPRNISASFSGFVAFQPPDASPRMFEFSDIEIPSTPPPYRDGGGVLIGTVKMTESNIEFNQVTR